MDKRKSPLEMLEMTPGFWPGKRVLVTGHTGFKGGWLSLWLQAMGAELHGYALQPPTEPNLFTAASVAQGMASSTIGDIRDLDKLSALVKKVHPEIVFHLAAQALVRQAYRNPVETYAVNVMGTVNLLEAVRAAGGVKAVVNVTSDKCYEDHESLAAHGENDALGGRDPYSSSKASAELVTAAYRASFLAADGVAVASARAGNVIGGGDWAEDRLLPDFFRALESGSCLNIRSPGATRPWQHVLEPVCGYLTLAERLYANGADFAEAWNFGPIDDDTQTVGWIVEHLVSANTGLVWQRDTTPQPQETKYLRLESSKAQARLGWRPRWRLPMALAKTLAWHGAMRGKAAMREVSLAQIDEYLSAGTSAAASVQADHGAF
jgi:CDP-glucose 4,6-dehydratase